MSTTSTRRRYRARVATDGATQVDGNVEFILDLGVLTEPPAFHGTVVDFIRATTQMRPFRVTGVDVAGFLTSSFSQSQRWAALGKLMDVQWNAIIDHYVDDDGWTTYGTGFVSQFGQAVGPRRYEMEVSGMSWRAAVGRLWVENDTVQLWPAGPVAPWRGFPKALEAAAGGGTDGRIPETKLVGVNLVAGGSIDKQSGIMPTEALIEFIRADAYPEEELIFGNLPDRGNFKNVRLNYDGVDYEVQSFGNSEENPLVASFEQPVVAGPDSPTRTVTIFAVIIVPIGVDLPEDSVGFIWAPTALPTRAFPYLIGLDSATHPWGNAGGGIHVADTTRRWAEGLGLVYNNENLAELEEDLSFPVLYPWVEDGETDTERFMEDKIWGHTRVAKVFDLQGRIKLADLRTPRHIPDDTPILDVTNSKNHTWEISEIRNSVSYKLAKLSAAPRSRRTRTLLEEVVLGPRAEHPVAPADVRLDGLHLAEVIDGPHPGDTIARAGEHPLTLDATASAYRGSPDGGLFGGLLGRHTSRQMVINTGRGLPWEMVEPGTTSDLLATLQDGLMTGEIDTLRSLAETIEEGQLIIIDLDSLKTPTPGRLGVLLPPSVGPVNPGGEVPELDDAPDIGTPELQDDLTIEVTISSVTDGRTLRVEFATNTSAVTPPAPTSQSWHTPSGGARTAPGIVVIPFQPRESKVWVRGSEEENGVRVTEYSTPVLVEVPAWPDFEMVDLQIFSGIPHAIWRKGALTEGVRILWVVHAANVAAPAFTDSVDVDADAGSYQLPTISVGQRITLEVQAWSGFDDSPDEVSGDLGETVKLAWTREQALADAVATLPIDLESEVEGVLPPANGGTGLGLPELAGQGGKLVAIKGDETGYEGVSASGLPSGTSFPVSPSTDDLFYRTDRHTLYFYDGTRWLSTTLYLLQLPGREAQASSLDWPLATNPFGGLYDLWFEKVRFDRVLSGSGNWTLSLQSYEANTPTTIVSTSSFTNTTRDAVDVTIGAVQASTIEGFNGRGTENSGTAQLFASGVVFFRVIG